MFIPARHKSSKVWESWIITEDIYGDGDNALWFSMDGRIGFYSTFKTKFGLTRIFNNV